MLLIVFIPAWHLDEDDVVVAVGDHLSTWLEFHESSRWDQPRDRQFRLTGFARAVPTWSGAERGRHPTVVETDGSTVYWDAPHPVTGPVDVTGVVSANNVDVPEGFPVTTGIVTRVRMEWQDHWLGDDGAWHPVPGTARYEDLPSSYLPREAAISPGGTTHETWTGVLVDLEVMRDDSD